MFDFLSELIPGKPFGLYITDRHIQAIQLKGSAKNPQIKAIGQRNIPSGIIRNGEIIHKENLSAEIKALLSETNPNPIKKKKCIMAIPETQSFEHIFYLPSSLKGEEFKSNLEKLIEENIPLPFNEVRYDYSIFLNKYVQAVFVVAVKKTVIVQYHETLKKYCNLDPIILEPESLSLLRNIPVNFEVDKGNILIDIKEDKINWFSLLGEGIFDSNCIAGHEYQKNPAVLVNDLNESINYFKEAAKQDIASIVISGGKEASTVLSQHLKEKIKLPIKLINHYKFIFELNENSDLTQFRMLGGIALKTLGIDIKTQINLLKK